MAKINKETEKLLERAYKQGAESALMWLRQALPREMSQVEERIYRDFIETNLLIFLASVEAGK